MLLQLWDDPSNHSSCAARDNHWPALAISCFRFDEFPSLGRDENLTMNVSGVTDVVESLWRTSVLFADDQNVALDYTCVGTSW